MAAGPRRPPPGRQRPRVPRHVFAADNSHTLRGRHDSCAALITTGVHPAAPCASARVRAFVRAVCTPRRPAPARACEHSSVRWRRVRGPPCGPVLNNHTCPSIHPVLSQCRQLPQGQVPRSRRRRWQGSLWTRGRRLTSPRPRALLFSNKRCCAHACSFTSKSAWSHPTETAFSIACTDTVKPCGHCG